MKWKTEQKPLQERHFSIVPKRPSWMIDVLLLRKCNNFLPYRFSGIFLRFSWVFVWLLRQNASWTNLKKLFLSRNLCGEKLLKPNCVAICCALPLDCLWTLCVCRKTKLCWSFLTHRLRMIVKCKESRHYNLD